MADEFVILNRYQCKWIPQDLALNYVGPFGHLWQILFKVTIDPSSCTRLLFPNGKFSSCFVFVLWEHVFYYRSQGKLGAMLKSRIRECFFLVVAIFCGALMPRAAILFSQTNTQFRHILIQLFLSQSGTDITNFHVLILLCHILPNPILCHFFPAFSSSYILMFSSSIKHWKYCFSSSKFSNSLFFQLLPPSLLSPIIISSSQSHNIPLLMA